MSDTETKDSGAQDMFPPLPLAEWRATKDTLHLYLQVVGKIRLELFPRMNHWWHVPLYVSACGLTTRAIPYGYGNFEVEFDFLEHALRITKSDGARKSFALEDGLSVADFYARVFENLSALGIEVKIRAVPYETGSTEPFATDREHAAYDQEYVRRFWQILVGVNAIFEEFRGRFTGKSTPVHLFWHSFDLALTRFSGREAPQREGAGVVEREAYSHEVISFGFWAGDDSTPAPAFYSYTSPEPQGLTGEPLLPEKAFWGELRGSAYALLMYDDIRRAESPRRAVLDFLQTAYEAGAKTANWDIEAFRLKPLTQASAGK
ncbi:MAG TPA: DUF5996 family protein [Pyrinomonadaceae bacterium]|nr:DUF5996 family protein [Pyrinomonadaceae bacterium]